PRCPAPQRPGRRRGKPVPVRGSCSCADPLLGCDRAIYGDEIVAMHHLVAVAVAEHLADLAAVPASHAAHFDGAVLAEAACDRGAGSIDDLDQVAAMELAVDTEHAARQQ